MYFILHIKIIISTHNQYKNFSEILGNVVHTDSWKSSVDFTFTAPAIQNSHIASAPKPHAPGGS